MFKDATYEETDAVMQQSWKAFLQYKKYSLKQRKQFMEAIADRLEKSDHELINTAMRETNLPEARLKSEKARTVLQLRQYGAACADGSWMEIRIDKAHEKDNRPDIRKTKVPLGPVIVFGASNFPFAYSTAGGDTACAFAAGCPVVVKAHPAHAMTSQMVADIILAAAGDLNMPDGIFAHVHGSNFEVSKNLVMHPLTKAVGFTGSLSGGKQLFDWGNQRDEPIPVFSEMGSTNPVFLLSQKLATDAEQIASDYAQSITQGAGQFCTNPGLIIGIQGDGLEKFLSTLKESIKKVAPQKMLHPGIAKAFVANHREALEQPGVTEIATTAVANDIHEGIPSIATVQAAEFIKNPLLRHEVFGPFSLVIKCEDEARMSEVADTLQGQLTATIIGTEKEIESNSSLVSKIENLCGRLILNGVPTGVAVCVAMQHGGPFPATTDSRFTSVGADGIKRFVRPIAYQNWPDRLLPEELKDSNPLKIWRTVDGVWTKE